MTDTSLELVRAVDTHTNQIEELTKVLDRHSDEQVTAINRVADALQAVAEAINNLEK